MPDGEAGGIGGGPRSAAGLRPLLARCSHDGAWTATGLAAFTALVFGPTFIQLSWDRAGRPAFWLLAALLPAVLAGMGAYTGWSVTGLSRGMGVAQAFPPFWLAAALIALVALPVVQAGGRLMSNTVDGRLFSRLKDGWKEIGYVSGSRKHTDRPSAEVLSRGSIEPVDKQWKDLRIGDDTYELQIRSYQVY